VISLLRARRRIGPSSPEAVHSRQSLEVYSRIALADAQQRYEQVIDRFPV